MKRNTAIVKLLIIIVWIMTGATFININNTHAATDYNSCINEAYHDGEWSGGSSITHTGIESLEWACSQCYNEGGDGAAYGTIWFNSFFPTSGSFMITGSIYNNGANFTDRTITWGSDETKYLYLYGQAYSCGYAGGAGIESGKMDAHTIVFYNLKEDGETTNGTVSYLGSLSPESQLHRGGANDRSWSWPTAAVSVALNIDEMAEYAERGGSNITKTYNSSKGTITYRDNIGVYRCPAGYPSYSDACVINGVPLKVTVNAPRITMRYVDTNGNSIKDNDGNTNQRQFSDYGANATMRAPNISGYTFQGFKRETTDSKYLSTSGNVVINGRTYTHKKVNQDIEVYAVYGPKHVFSVGFQDTSGKRIRNDYEENSVEYGSTVKYTEPDITGYTFQGWKSDGPCSGRVKEGKQYLEYTANPPKCDDGTENKGYWLSNDGKQYNYMNMTNNVRVYAVYVRNEFKAQARVAEGSSWSGSVTNKKSSGFVTEGSAGTVDIECASASGCTAGFWFDLKTVAGTGRTYYSIRKNVDGGEFSWVIGEWVYPSTSGDQVYSENINVSIGQTVCYKIMYYQYISDDATKDIKEVSACARVKPSRFEGKSSVAGAASDNTDWQSKNTSKVVHINNCSPTAGCKVSFKHELKRTAGAGSTDYKVIRTVNYTESLRSIKTGTADGNNNVKSGTFNQAKGQVSGSGEWTLYPGMVVCEKLTFTPNNLAGTGSVYTMVCASALGNAQPSGENSLVDIKVKNNNVSKYNSYDDEVYAKPGDSLTYRGTYNPILQYTYYLIPQKFRIDSGTIYTNTSSLYLYQAFNQEKTTGMKNWNNAMSISKPNGSVLNYTKYDHFLTPIGLCGSNCASTISGDYSYGNTAKKIEYNDYNVSSDSVGGSLNETIKTNRNDTTKTTPSQVSFSESGSDNVGIVITSSVSATAYARIPYNFINTVSITDSSTEKILYAGEENSIGFKISVNKKQNNETDGNYATKVSGAKWKMEICFSGACYETDAKSGNLNSGRSWRMEGTTREESMSFSAPDLAAGSEICVRSAVYPANSGADTNYSDKEGSHTWQYSERVCYKVAKRPSFQVWGIK